MKKYLFFIGLAIASLIYSCGKTDSPAPVTPPVTKPVDNSPTDPPTSATLAITDFSPKSAKPASKITITGTGFGNDPAAVYVAIGNLIYGNPISVTPTTIVAETNASTPTGKITVSIGGKTVTSSASFTAVPEDLQILSFQGSAGQVNKSQLGHRVFVSSKGFGADTNKIFISFGGTKAVKANYIGPNKTGVGTIVPRYAKAGKVTLTVDGRSTTSDVDFNIEMSMRDFSPKSVTTGDTMIITGVDFADKQYMYVDLNAATGYERPFKVTPTELWVIVPFNAKPGRVGVHLGAPYGSIDDSSDDKFTFTPRVSFNNFFTPASGKVNDLIRINGDFSGADISTIGVSFGGSKAVKPTSITGPDIYVKVPADAKTGKITISRTGYTPLTGSFVFTVMP